MKRHMKKRALANRTITVHAFYLSALLHPLIHSIYPLIHLFIRTDFTPTPRAVAVNSSDIRQYTTSPSLSALHQRSQSHSQVPLSALRCVDGC